MEVNSHQEVQAEEDVKVLHLLYCVLALYLLELILIYLLPFPTHLCTTFILVALRTAIHS